MSRQKKLKVIDLGARGKYNPNNKLNDLTGKEWIKFTKSWFIHRPQRRKEAELLHPAKFPETLVEEFIRFFTKEGEWIIDPFMGTGSALISAIRSNRNGIGIELEKKYFKIAKQRLKKEPRTLFTKSEIKIFNSNSLKLLDFLNEHPPIKYCITSPPYWNQLERNTIRQADRKQKKLDTKYSESQNDLGNCKNYDEFIEKICQVFDNVYDIIENLGYLTIIINNIYYKGKLYPLAFDLAIALTKRGEKSWVMKDEKIWLQDDKPLIALGINSAWIGNRHHQYCLNFRKEKNG
ncbi:MAG: site-specific DNA-methyltransferase [Ignavibacteria bacterium]|nr:site-specific DNA-methyltransferase [Ignavibacteria bacterium]